MRRHDAALSRLMQAVEVLPGLWPLTGGIITITNREGRVTQRAFGNTAPAGDVPVDENHLFEIGSISKIFNGLLMMALVDDGLCDLDDPVLRHLPWFRVGSDFAPITLRHLLHHTSGIIKGADEPPDGLAQCVSLAQTRTGTPPGTYFNYSNVGYMLIGEVIRALTGQSVAAFCKTRLLDPAGMGATIAEVRNSDRARLAVGTAPATDDQPWRPSDPIAPAIWFEVDAPDGNVASSATDMARFLQLLLGRGEIAGNRIISDAAFARMTGDLAISGEDWVDGFGALPVETSHYGLGINVETVAGRRCITHGGGMVGYSTFALADLDADLGISVLTNANGCYPVGQVIARLAHALLTDEAAQVPPLDLRFNRSSPAFRAGMIGEFVAMTQEAPQITVSADPDGNLRFLAMGQAGAFYRTWSAGLTSDHPRFRRYQWSYAEDDGGGQWSWGPMSFRAPDAARTAAPPDPAAAALVGRYRAFCPWYPTFRVVIRDGRLLLIAPGGVEAPTDDTDLVPLGGGVFRIGSDARAPERLIAGPLVNGVAAWVSRDGCRHSRVFMEDDSGAP